MSKFYLPDLGEGLQGAEIVEWKIKTGEKVSVDQLILIVETAKAIVEIPSPVEGVIKQIHFNAGDMVDVGQVLMEYSESGSIENTHQVVSFEEERVGVEAKSRSRSVSVVGKLPSNVNKEGYDDILVDEVSDQVANISSPKPTLDAPPSVRLFAEKLGVEDNLSAHAYGELNENSLMKLYNNEVCESTDSKDRNAIMKLKGARKVMAQTMARSHEQIPAVTLFDDADISHWSAEEDITLRCITAIIQACRVEPILNAWFDEETMSIQFFDDIHLGVAVNSDEGLFVPVIRKAQELKGTRIREILEKQVKSIRNRTIKPQKLLGATISLSNFGSLSGRYATPIIVPPQVAIVGVGVIREEPVVQQKKLVVGRIMPISLSFDHRAASGAEAARFMKAFIDALRK